MKTLFLYSKNGCGACIEAKKFLTNLEIPFKEIDVERNKTALNKLHADGHKYVPQFYADDYLFMRGGWNTVRTMRKHEILDRLK